MRGPGQCLQSSDRDRLAAADTHPECPLLEPLDGPIDQLELLRRAIAQREVPLLFEHLARGSGLRAIGHLARCPDLLTQLFHEPRPLSVERRANGHGIEVIHPGTVPVEALHARPALYSSEYRRRKAPMAIEIDPVCGMEVDTTTSLLSYEYDGKTYWFCGKGCLLEFKDDPEKYLDPDYQASM